MEEQNKELRIEEFIEEETPETERNSEPEEAEAAKAEKPEKPKSSKGKKIAIIVTSVVLIAAIVVGAVLLITRNSGNKGPTDENGDPLYPASSDVTSIEYLHRGGLDTDSASLTEYELTDEEGIATFLDSMKALELRDPTDEDRAAVDYSADIEMFTLKTEDKDIVLLVMGDTISISNSYGNYFYVMTGFDLETLTKDFEDMDLASKLSE